MLKRWPQREHQLEGSRERSTNEQIESVRAQNESIEGGGLT